MNILISGGTGFIGSAFSAWLLRHSNRELDMTWLSRDANQQHPTAVNLMSYEQLKTTTKTFDVIINLAGSGIADKRWTDERKKELMQSRLQPTQAIINYIASTETKPKLLLSGSAVGWYGTQGDKQLDEQSGYRDDFAHQLCEAWEREAEQALNYAVPVAILRTGIVIHPSGGMIAKLLLPFKIGAGGKLGDGQQFMSWISLEDWIRAAWFIIEHHLDTQPSTDHKTAAKVYNLTAPTPIRNVEFTKALGVWLHRPTFMTLPAWLLKTMFAEMSTLLIDGQRVLPQAILEQGFEFKQLRLQQALAHQPFSAKEL